MRKYRKVCLYKLGRYQQDFEYLFPKIKIKKYIVDDKTKVHNGIECIKLDDLKFKKSKIKDLIVICDKRLAKISDKFSSLGFIEHKDYMFLEDFGRILDDKMPRKTRKKIDMYKEKYDIDLDYYDQSNSKLFKKMIYTDAKYSLDCTRGFTSVQVHESGFIYPCCRSWATEYIGSAYHESPNKIWNSTRARLFRLSLINKTYAFCNLDNCSLTDEGLTKDNLRLEEVKELASPEFISIAYDRTCNLKCKSCRDCSSNYNKDKLHKEINEVIRKRLLKDNWFDDSKQLLLAAQGEVFFSDSYRKILDDINKVECLYIHTNGILLNQERIDEISKKAKRVFVFVSVDAVNNDTYSKIRIGGNLNVLKKNLALLSKAKEEGKIEYINILCVLQKGNYKELPDLVKYAISINADNLDVTRIFNWGTFSDEEFKEVSMYDEAGNPKPELVEVLNDPIFKTDKICLMGNVLKDIVEQKSDNERYKWKKESND